MAYAGMDVGTSGCKLLVYDLNGSVLYQTARRYKEDGSGGLRELDPAMVRESILDICREAGEKCPVTIEAIAFASLGESIVCLDPKDRVLAKTALTGDSRGKAEVDRLILEKGAQHIFEVTGLPPNELYGLPKYMWMNTHTNAIRDAEKILFYEDFAGYILTGRRVVSYSSAARSMAFNIHTKQWDEELLSMAGIQASQMSTPAPSGTIVGRITAEMAEKTGLDPNLKIVVGGHDQSCAALGSGLKDMQTGEVGMGTCEFMFVMLPEQMTTPEMAANNLTCIPYIFENTYLSNTEVTTCGILKNWAFDTIFSDIRRQCEETGENFFEHMDTLAKDAYSDVLVLPQFGSSGPPDMSMDAWGTITGLTTQTTPGEIYRALLEGMAFQMLLAYERMRPLGTTMDSMVATGGGAASELTLQIRADIFEMTVKSLESDEAGTLGCMMLAATAMQAYPDLSTAVDTAVKTKKTYTPDPAHRQYYAEKYRKYEKLFDLMHAFH